ncbi:KIN14H [Symbiodinium sp. CCMP2456]|nr:KIN14H [Symbiodinium sp. CCMP2456]
MVIPPVRSPGKRLESTPEKENSFGSWNLDLGRFQRKCAEISASLSQPSLGDRVRAETARSGDAPLPSTSTVLQGEAWSPSPSPHERGEPTLSSERSPLQDCTVQVQSPTGQNCAQFRSPHSSPLPVAAKAAVQLVPSPSLGALHPLHAVGPTRWCLPEFEDLRRKMQHSISALQRSNAQQAEMQAALSQALQRGESFKEEAQEARRSKDRHHHKWCALDQEREALQRAAQAAQAAERAARGAERSALEEAAAWRRWLASFLDVLLRRGTQSHLQADVSASQCFEERQPKLHTALQQLSQLSERPSLEPGLLAEMSDLYAWLAGVMGENRLSVIWNDGHEVQQKADDRVAQLERKLAQKEIAVASLEHEKRALRSEVRTLQNLVQELRGSIRVFCRIRPPKQPAGSLAGAATEAQGARSISLRKPAGDKRQDFSFDRVFSQLAGQRDLYEEVEPLIPGVLQGIHVCILAYGQTGAGKTYTLAGDRSTGEPGIQDLAIADLLKLALSGSSEGARYDVRLSALEIYNESIQDLLSDPEAGPREGLQEGPCERSERLEVRQSREEASGSWPSPFGSMRVPGLTSRAVRESSDVEQALGRIGRQRHVASTALNERSSRSHCVLSLCVRAAGGAGDDEGHRGCGVLHIVDLAGSERTKVSQAEGMQMKEANCINRSLSALSDVLSALGDSSGNAHIPFRNSKLTYLLQDALGGPGCKTFLFAQVSPEVADANESYSTLTFASRVAAHVQKGRLRPMSRQGPLGLGGSPAARAQDASPRLRSQDSEPSLASPVLRARGVAPPLPGLGRKPR